MSEIIARWFGEDWDKRSMPVPTPEQRKTIMGCSFFECELPSGLLAVMTCGPEPKQTVYLIDSSHTSGDSNV